MASFDRKDWHGPTEIATINKNQYKLENIKSFKIEFTSYLETITLKMKTNERISLTGFVDGKKSLAFQSMKEELEMTIMHNNQNSELDDKIARTGFFESKFAIPVGVLIIGLLLIGTISLFCGKLAKPQNLLIFAGISTPFLIQIFAKNR